ncbi:MAG: DUF2490 domain-containing protein [Verrucomicrobia bacterium]|nr:DUF2490 domain-containing protein [Verrucomicrobiota bacterium]
MKPSALSQRPSPEPSFRRLGIGRAWGLVCSTAFALLAAAESVSNNNLWINYAGDHPVQGGPWGIHLESQWRRSDFGGGWQQILLRPGVNYTINRAWSVSAGYAWVETHPYSSLPIPHEFPENRIWEQVVFAHGGLGLEWSHRLRLEQRFIGQMAFDNGDWDVASWRYENRIRYLLRTTLPISRSGRWYLTLWDEVFFNFGSNVSGNDFDQNRVFFGLGCKLTDTTRLEVGYMEQTLQRRGGAIWENNHTLALWLMSRWPFGKGE